MRHIAMFQKESRLAASVPLRGSASPRELLTRPLRDLSRLCANLPFFQTVVTKRRLNAASSYRPRHSPHRASRENSAPAATPPCRHRPPPPEPAAPRPERQSVGWGQSGHGRVNLGGRRTINKK